MKTLKILQHHNTATPPHSPTALSSREEEGCSCTRLGRVVSLCCLQQAAVQVVRVLSSLGEKLKHEKIERHRTQPTQHSNTAPTGTHISKLTVGSSRPGVCCWKASRARRSWSVKLICWVPRSCRTCLGILGLGFSL